jgi:hypothetical protein
LTSAGVFAWRKASHAAGNAETKEAMRAFLLQVKPDGMAGTIGRMTFVLLVTIGVCWFLLRLRKK